MTTNYKEGKIYKIEPIINGEDGEIYIGSTTQKYLSQRMTAHRTDYKRWLNREGNKTMSHHLFEKYGVDHCNIVLLENFPCESKDQLISRESYYIRTLTCVNKRIPDRSKKEYVKDNKENFKKYYEINKEKINKWCKTPYNCECGSICRTGDKAVHLKSKKHQTFLSSK